MRNAKPDVVMPNGTLTVNLPAEEIEFLKAYARQHGMTAAEVVGRYVQRLKSATQPPIHPEVAAISGLVPPGSDARTEYRQRLLEKHR
ncbi:MAG: DUF6364 family protein [Limisphaerales bacterium]